MITTSKPPCLYPNCTSIGVTRGLCPSHYACARGKIKRKLAREDDLINRGLMLRAARGKSADPVGAFLKGSTIKGKAAVAVPTAKKKRGSKR